MANDANLKTIVTPVGRLSFPRVFEPGRADPDSDLKYSCTLLFDDDVDLTKLKKAAQAAAMEKFGDKAAALLKAGAIRLPFRRQEEKPNLSGYGEGVFIGFNNSRKPAVLDPKRQPVTDEEEVYPGRYARCVVDCYAWDHKSGGKGVSFSLTALQLGPHGERIDGRMSTAQAAGMLDDLDGGDDAPVTAEDDDLLF